MIRITISRGEERTGLFCDKCGRGYVWDHIVSKSCLIKVGRNKGRGNGKIAIVREMQERKAE